MAAGGWRWGGRAAAVALGAAVVGAAAAEGGAPRVRHAAAADGRVPPGALPPGAVARNFEAVGYSDLGGRPAFKLTITERGGRWYLYAGHFWHRGWSVVDVTDPRAPRVVRFLPGPANTFTGQVDLADSLLVTGLEKILPGFGGDTAAPYAEGVWFWDVRDPANPRRVGEYRTGGTGTHRNGYFGGRYVHLAAGMPGYDGNIYVILDATDPARPREAGRWWVPGQDTARGERPAEPHVSLHGPPTVVGETAYLPYGAAGMVILDVRDKARPKPVGRLDFSPPFSRRFGAHSVLPLPARGLAFVNSEDVDYGRGAAEHASVVDVSDPTSPTLLSVMPRPAPPPGAPYRDFADAGGWSGPHNTNQHQHNPAVQRQGALYYLTYFNAGLRAYDVRDPRAPREAGYFLPPAPRRRYGPLPAGRLATQTEDVLVDRRGYAYLTDKNQGLWVVRYTGPALGPAPAAPSRDTARGAR